MARPLSQIASLAPLSRYSAKRLALTITDTSYRDKLYRLDVVTCQTFFEEFRVRAHKTALCGSLLSLCDVSPFFTSFIMMTARSPACQSLRSGAGPRICSSRRVGLFKPVAFISRSPSSSTDEAISLQRVQAGQRRPLSMPTIKLITATVEIQAQTQRFERLAGRSAMVRSDVFKRCLYPRA